MLIGLVYVAEGKETARYYWIINWLDPEAGSPDFWALKAPPAERLAFVLKMIEGIDERFASVIKATKVEDMAAPLALKDLVPIETPRGRVSLLGDAAHPMTPCKLRYMHPISSNPIDVPSSPWRRRQQRHPRRPQLGKGDKRRNSYDGRTYRREMRRAIAVKNLRRGDAGAEHEVCSGFSGSSFGRLWRPLHECSELVEV